MTSYGGLQGTINLRHFSVPTEEVSNRSTICRRHWLGSKQRTKQSAHQQRKDRTILYKKKWRRTLEKMQISRQPLEHNRRDQKKNWQMQIYNILEDRSTTLKIRTLDAYVGSMTIYVLYNSELWTVTQDLEDF